MLVQVDEPLKRLVAEPQVVAGQHDVDHLGHRAFRPGGSLADGQPEDAHSGSSPAPASIVAVGLEVAMTGPAGGLGPTPGR